MDYLSSKCAAIIVCAGLLLFSASVSRAGEALLSWEAPVTNIDGTPATDLNGYKIHVGTSPGNYSQNIETGSTQTTYTVTNLTEGATYYFAVTACDASGFESSFSNEVSKTIQASMQTTTPAPDPTQPTAVYQITATSGSNGAITPLGNVVSSNTSDLESIVTTVTANQNDCVSFSITPDAGYHIADVSVDGTSVGALSLYAFSNIAANHTITATFALGEPLIKATKGDVNGDGLISLTDVLITLRSIVDSTELPAAQKEAVDVWPPDDLGKPAGDGKIALDDVLAILRKAVKPETW